MSRLGVRCTIDRIIGQPGFVDRAVIDDSAESLKQLYIATVQKDLRNESRVATRETHISQPYGDAAVRLPSEAVGGVQRCRATHPFSDQPSRFRAAFQR